MENDIKLPRGTTYQTIIEIYDKDDSGKIYELQDNESIIFAVKKRTYKESPYLIKKILTISDKKEKGYLLYLKPEDTVNLKSGFYFYDVGIVRITGDYEIIIPCSMFKVLDSITEGGIV